MRLGDEPGSALRGVHSSPTQKPSSAGTACTGAPRATTGVPAPGDATSGASINHPDVDLADPEWNTPHCPWYSMYYRGNYPRLQRVKLRWDPLEVFHHALSIAPTPSVTARQPGFRDRH
ncbi:BBE domain-containing protein [Cryptosporangium minutisporangium]|uniref:BBE domain-containing protein n=1 Tax=Cryptosporangium minutisporangium TaxID=113569 RepID=UPI0035EDE763